MSDFCYIFVTFWKLRDLLWSPVPESFELTFRPADVDLSTCTNLIHQQPWQKFRHFISKLGGGDLVRQWNTINMCPGPLNCGYGITYNCLLARKNKFTHFIAALTSKESEWTRRLYDAVWVRRRGGGSFGGYVPGIALLCSHAPLLQWISSGRHMCSWLQCILPVRCTGVRSFRCKVNFCYYGMSIY